MIHQVSNYVFVNYDFGVPPFCLHAMPILPDFQLPKQNKADIVTTKSKSTQVSRADESPCSIVYLCVIAVAVRYAHLDAVLGVVEVDHDVVVCVHVPGRIRGHSGNE